jgi:3-oxoacyl-[acyl-carrier-protein] synthase II
MEQRVVVTGIGLITPLGFGKVKTWNALIAGQSAVRQDHEFQEIVTARVENFDVPPGTRLLSLGYLAAAEAMRDSAMQTDTLDMTRFGCTVSVSKPDISAFGREHLPFSEAYYPSNVGNQLARIFKLRGPNRNIAAACATGTDAVILGAEWIRYGICDVVMVGAVESPFHPLYVAGFQKMGVLSRKAARPFDRDRDGFALAEGAGILILERKDRAAVRGAKIYGEITSGIKAHDAHSPVAFTGDGQPVADAVKSALRQGGLESVGYVNLHGTGTKLNDIVETRAMKAVFGDEVHRISFSSTKGATGHMLGASGAVEFAVSLLAMNYQLIPPTMGLFQPDDECTLDYTIAGTRYRSLSSVMSLSLGFGGHIGVITAVP